MKNFLRIAAITGLVSLLAEACAHNPRNSCSTWELNNRRRLEACILYDEEGKPASSRYTIYNGWGLPAATTYDNGLDGIDENIRYEYDQHHKLRATRLREGNGRREERIYDKNGKVVLILVDENGDGELRNRPL